jgi:putative DNA primase/helicase
MVRADELPVVTVEQLQAFIAEAEKIIRAAGAMTRREQKRAKEDVLDFNSARPQRRPIRKAFDSNERPDRATVDELLSLITNDKSYDEWIKIGFALYDALGDGGFDLWVKWSAQSRKDDEATTARKWKSFAGGNKVTFRTLYWEAMAGGWKDKARQKNQQRHDRAERGAAGGHADAPEDETGRPVIRFADHDKPAIAKRAEEILLNDEHAEIYQRGGSLVRPILDDADASHGRRTKIAKLVGVTPVYLRNQLDKSATWQKFDRRNKEWYPAGAPKAIAEIILSQVGHWTFQRLAGVITTQTMRPDGSILSQEGYDAATRLLLMSPPPMPAIPYRPTKDDAVAALKLLKELLSEFPFVDDVARAVALSCLITPVVRGAFPHAPLHAANAPVAGTGKSFLGDIASTISTGRPMPVISVAAGKEDELEKRLVAAVISGQPMVSIDNVNGELRSDLLCQLITQQIVDLRILGKSEQKSVETRGLTCFATGNNLQICSDLTRRSLVSSLDARVERPELREFKQKPTDLVLANRGKYIAACLTIARAYITAGHPGKLSPLASFEGWSDTVRSALAGC